MKTEEWITARMGELFEKRGEKGEESLPTLSVTIDRGLVRRDSIDRKMDTTLEPHQHLLVREGDIAYNMMRMWQGASGRAEVDGIVSPAYVVLRPTTMVDSHFAAHFFKLPHTIKKFEDYSHGLTSDRLRLYYHDFAAIPTCVPALPEQQKIAAILSTWDRAIELTEKLIAAKQKCKQALMQQLLTGMVRFVEFGDPIGRNGSLPEGWNEIALAKIADVTMGTSPPSAAYNSDEVGLPLIQGNADIQRRRTRPRVWTSVLTKTCEIGDCLMSVRAPVGEVAISEHRACIGRGICGIRAKKECYQPFIIQLMLGMEPRWCRISQGSTFDSVTGQQVKSLPVVVPAIEEQKAIAAVLNANDKEINLLTQRLHAIKQQKKGLMQQLLTCKIRITIKE